MSQEIAAGYLLLRRVPRPEYASATLLPDRILSASECICPRFPDPAALSWVSASEKERSDALRAVGLPRERHSEAETWATAEFGKSLGWPGVFYSVAAALQARETFFGSTADLAVVGIALSDSQVEEFVTAATPQPPQEGYAPQGESGYLEVVKKREPLAPGHRRLGYELLNVEVGLIGCSWLCNGLESHCATHLGVRPGATGLLEILGAAEECRAEISQEGVGAEPGPWFSWLLVEYA